MKGITPIVAVILVLLVVVVLVFFAMTFSGSSREETALDRFMQDRSELFDIEGWECVNSCSESTYTNYPDYDVKITGEQYRLWVLNKQAFASSLLEGEWGCVDYEVKKQVYTGDAPHRGVLCVGDECRNTTLENGDEFVFSMCTLYSNSILEATPEELERWGVGV